MAVYINDANILIDIVNVGLVNEFAQLDFELRTNNLIIEEIKEHMDVISPIIKQGLLSVVEIQINEYQSITDLLTTTKGLSFEDCSVLYQAQSGSHTLLTCDGRLRKKATSLNVQVRGSIYIIDEIYDQNLIGISVYIEKLEILKSSNTRLPMSEIDKRINKAKSLL